MDPRRYRVHPLWWPALLPLSPVLAGVLARKSRAFERGVRRADEVNADRLASAEAIPLPALRSLKLTPVVEQAAATGFASDAAVSYLLETDRGRLLFDVGFGPQNDTFAHNWRALGAKGDDLDAVVISHLHLDHMGGMQAQRRREVDMPAEARPSQPIPCYLPDQGGAPGLRAEILTGPCSLPAGLGTTGPLTRMLYFFGEMQEQSLIAHVAGRGLVVVVGCAHPSIELILTMARSLSSEPLYAFVGGIHRPVTASRVQRYGLQAQRIFGTGKRWDESITEADLDQTIEVLRRAAPRRLLISAHDSCDHTLRRLEEELDTDFAVLHAGEAYELGEDR